MAGKKPSEKSNVKQKDVKLDRLRTNKTHTDRPVPEEVKNEIKSRGIANEIKKNKPTLKTTVHGEHRHTYNDSKMLKKSGVGHNIVVSKVVKNLIDALKKIEEKVTNKSLEQAILNLKKETRRFQREQIDADEYKKNCRKIVKGIDLPRSARRAERNIFDELHEIIRLMFKVIDYIVTSVATLGKKTSMSHTPGARSLVGRDHFFNPLTEDTKFQKMVRQFEQSLDKLDESKTHTVKL